MPICCASVPRSFTVSHDVSFRNDGTPQLSVEFMVSVTQDCIAIFASPESLEDN